MRLTYETEQDRAHEAKIGQYLSDRWACQIFKLKPYYGLDFAIFVDGRMRGVMEIKCRTYTSEQLTGMGGADPERSQVGERGAVAQCPQNDFCAGGGFARRAVCVEHHAGRGLADASYDFGRSN